MNGLVEQLQNDALNPDVPVSTLLRKVKVAAVKLGLTDAISWVDSELNGFNETPPNYRTAQGSTVGWNPYHGWQPVHFQNGELGEMISKCELRESIASYEAILAQNSDQGMVRLELRTELVALLNQTFKFDVPRVANRLSTGTLVGVVNHVRNMVLDWSLELAAAGITGDGLSFSNEEKAKASNAHITIGTFNGSFNAGDISGQNARLNQGSTDNSFNLIETTTVFDQIEAAVVSGVSNPEERDKLVAATHSLRKATTTEGKLNAYNGFIQSAANHMTVVAPFLPALAALIS